MTTQTIAELEALPRREGGYDAAASWFPRLLIVPDPESVNGSGYRNFSIIGANSAGEGIMHLAYSDNVRLPAEPTGDYPGTPGERGDLGIDVYPNGIVAVFGRFFELSVGPEMESSEILVRRRDHWLNGDGLLTFGKGEND